MKHLHFLGVCGTFMGSLAILAKQMGYHVTGSDENIYPPMSSHLEAQGIDIWPGYLESHFATEPDLVIVGNAISRGNPALEFVLNHKLPYTSGPQWLAENVLHNKYVVAVTGTHGKTTVSSMLAWILDAAKLKPGFLIGGVAENFATSARLTDSQYFVIEGDEYDTAFFDKRSKFVHYRPDVAIINNIEFDHADIFSDVQAIQRHFHQLVRVMPSDGTIIAAQADRYIDEMLAMGCWSHVQRFGAQGDWSYCLEQKDGSAFTVLHRGKTVAKVNWQLYGEFNVMNAIAAIAAAYELKVSPTKAAAALATFKGVKKRLQVIANANDILVLSDFAHHPTAIAATLQAVKSHFPDNRIIAVVEPRSNSMRMGVHREPLLQALKHAHLTYVYEPEQLQWSLADKSSDNTLSILHNTEELLAQLIATAKPGDVFVVMSNGSFDALPVRLQTALAASTRADAVEK